MEQLIVLGTGAAIISKYYNTCFALYNGDEYFLVDGGGGNIMRQAELAGIDWHRLRNIFISHTHTDHIFGVIWAIRKISHIMQEEDFEGNVRIFGHEEVLDDLKAMCNITISPGQMKRINERIEFIAVKHGEEQVINQYKLTFFDIFSNKAKQMGFSLLLPSEKNVVFLGDEPYNEQNRRFVAGCDWLLSEAYCLYRDRDIFNPYRWNHNTLKEACVTAEELGAKNLVIWHTEDRTFGEKPRLYLQEGRRYYTGNLIVPVDLDVIEID